MRGYTLYIWLGAWLFLLPFLGIPGTWKDAFLILTALVVIAYSYVLHRRTRRVVRDIPDVTETPPPHEAEGDKPAS